MGLGGIRVLVTCDVGLAVRIAAGLEELGVMVGRSPGDGSTSTRDKAIETFAAAAGELGGLDAVVHVPAAPLQARVLNDTDEDASDSGAEAAIREALVAFQAAHATFGGRGGAIAVPI